MIRFLMEAGPVIIPLTVLAVVIEMLFLWNAVALIAVRAAGSLRRRRSIDSILFWGSVAGVLGFLGQWIGVARMARAVAEQGIVSPQAVTYGLSESLLTPVTGIVIFIVAAFSWFLLRIALWEATQRRRPGVAHAGRR